MLEAANWPRLAQWRQALDAEVLHNRAVAAALHGAGEASAGDLAAEQAEDLRGLLNWLSALQAVAVRGGFPVVFPEREGPGERHPTAYDYDITVQIRLTSDRPLSPPQVQQLTEQARSAMAWAHDKGSVTGDLFWDETAGDFFAHVHPPVAHVQASATVAVPAGPSVDG